MKNQPELLTKKDAFRAILGLGILTLIYIWPYPGLGLLAGMLQRICGKIGHQEARRARLRRPGLYADAALVAAGRRREQDLPVV